MKTSHSLFPYVVKAAHIPLIKSLLCQLIPKQFSQLHQAIQREKDEEFSLLHLLCIKDQLSIDVGVLYGGYAREMMRFSSSVAMVEANPEQVAFLKRAFPKQQHMIIGSAAGDQKGELKLRIPRNMPGNATVEKENTLSKHRDLIEYLVPVTPLDILFGSEKVGFIKIDVEGHENAVLRGATAIIQHSRPRFILECGDHHKKGAVQDMFAFFHAMKYQVFFMYRGKLQHANQYNTSFSDAKNRNSRDHVSNFIAIANEESDALTHAIEDYLPRLQ